METAATTMEVHKHILKKSRTQAWHKTTVLQLLKIILGGSYS